ncbi:MAG TPA: hypothetical protein VN692_16835 [Steroidobacteraceae bacterium]|nr:hypothetical protein [Steroidobacteraceae bacterium]
MFGISQRCAGARALEKGISAAQGEITIPILDAFHLQAQVGEMFENLVRMLGPLGTFRGGENAAVGDDADDKEYGHHRAECDLHF